eukprot:SM000221S06939  [mRNA]  locus=s221:151787:154330:+ [translate_table: standard]
MVAMDTSVASVVFKLLLRQRFGRADGGVQRAPPRKAAPDAGFRSGVATKDLVVSTATGLAVRIFLPEAVRYGRTPSFGWMKKLGDHGDGDGDGGAVIRDGGLTAAASTGTGSALSSPRDLYRGYIPAEGVEHRKFPVIVQFHGGGFVIGSKHSPSNDTFCRRLAIVCGAMVVAVDYRLAPEHKCPAPFEDGFEVLRWLARQSNVAEFATSPAGVREKAVEKRRSVRELAGSLTSDVLEPWLVAHADLSRCLLLGDGAGANIADHVTRQALSAADEIRPIRLVAQVLLYPFFGGNRPTASEIKMPKSYFYDRATCDMLWRHFLPEEEYNAYGKDHPACDPMMSNRSPPYKEMPPTLFVVADRDMLRDRAIAYAHALRKAGVDAPCLDYRDCSHGFATMEPMVHHRQAEVCAEDIAIWLNKHVGGQGSELSY